MEGETIPWHVEAEFDRYKRCGILDYGFVRLYCKACDAERLIELGEGKFAWKDPPCEYDYKTLPTKLIYGSKMTDDKFAGRGFSITDPFWHEGIESYIKRASDFLIDPRQLKGPR